MDAEDYKDARERERPSFDQLFMDLHDTVNRAPVNKGTSSVPPKCYLCKSTNDIHWNDSKPGFFICSKCREKWNPPIKIKDGRECPF